MYLNHFDKTDMARLDQILSTLKNVHGIVMRFDLEDPSTEGKLFECIRQWDEHRGRIVAESQFNTYQQNPDYIKSMLILEAARIMLKEIAPKRRRNKMNESDMSAEKNPEPRKKASLSMQLSDIAARIPQWSEEASAFSNELAAMSDNIRHDQPLTSMQKEILTWIRSLPKPITLSAISDEGTAKYGTQLAAARKSELEALPKVDMTKEGKDQDKDGDSDFADIMIARMVKSGMPKAKAIASTSKKSYNKESTDQPGPLSAFKRKQVQGLYNYDHFEDPQGNWIQVRADKSKFAHFDKASGKITSFDTADELKAHLAQGKKTESMVSEAVEQEMPAEPAPLPAKPVGIPQVGRAHHYEYQASMARSELYRNAKYATSMMQQVDPHAEVHPWIAGSLTKAANLLDKVYHYLDYYKTFEPEKLPEGEDEDSLGETSGGVTRQNLMLIIEYSTKLFEMIKPGDKLEGWVAMKLTTASEAISCCKHYMDYVQFEKHAQPHEFLNKTSPMKESKQGETMVLESEDLAKAATIIDAKNMASKVQEIAEDLAEMSVEDLMPLVDIMRAQFGPEAADGFNQSVKSVLTKLLDQTVQAKHTLDDAIDTLNKGGVPSEMTDLEKPEAADDMQDEVSDDTDISKDLESLAGSDKEAEEPESSSPLGREKKEVSENLNEAWDAKMHTAKKDIGKWKGWTIERLESKLKKLMDKKERSEAEQKEVKQLQFAIRAKHKGAKKWGKVEESLNEVAPPGEKAEEFIKKNKESFKKRYGERGEEVLYATAWKKFGPKTESYQGLSKDLDQAKQELIKLEAQMAGHRKAFKQKVQEGIISDPLNMGYGLEGDAILDSMSQVNKRVAAIKQKLGKEISEGISSLRASIAASHRAKALEDVRAKTPYGVIYKDGDKRLTRMFETADARDTWISYMAESITTVSLIDPEALDKAISSTRKKG